MSAPRPKTITLRIEIGEGASRFTIQRRVSEEELEKFSAGKRALIGLHYTKMMDVLEAHGAFDKQ